MKIDYSGGVAMIKSPKIFYCIFLFSTWGSQDTYANKINPNIRKKNSLEVPHWGR